ncbi:ubiquitin 3 binding protein But2 C-terminal domain-containing protein [Jackrogersella minutella]|nr:ubiquitin 3 binding protein But2 C-terminal domain-containing protein [Jackrogersella minutella]
MKFLLCLVLSLGTASAAPFELVSKRALEDHQWTRDKKGCPAYLEKGQYEFPHYITQVSKSQPNRAFGPQYNARITPNDVSTIFSFDVPQSRADANCTLEFLFPRQDQLRTSKYKYQGGGTFSFTGYLAGSCPGPNTTWNNQPTPGVFPPFPPIHMEPGYAYTIDVGPCIFAAGTCVSGMTSSNDTNFEFFEDDDNCPIGMYNAYSYGLPCKPEFCGSS